MAESRAERREERTAFLFLAPGLVLFFLFVLLPVVAALYLSFCRYDIIHSPVWIGLRNYARIGKDLANHGVFYLSLRNTAPVSYTHLTLPTNREV